MTDLSVDAVERLAVIHDNLALVKGTLPATADGNRKTAATLRALLAAKEGAEAREARDKQVREQALREAAALAYEVFSDPDALAKAILALSKKDKPNE